MDSSIARPSDSRREYTTRQVRDWCNLREDTFRYWKEVLPPIANRDGRGSRYSFAEIVALAAIAAAVAKLDLKVSVFALHADLLFEAIATYLADPAPDFVMVIHDQTISFVRLTALPDTDALALVRIGHIEAEVRSRMTPPSVTPSQFNLFEALR